MPFGLEQNLCTYLAALSLPGDNDSRANGPKINNQTAQCFCSRVQVVVVVVAIHETGTARFAHVDQLDGGQRSVSPTGRAATSAASGCITQRTPIESRLIVRDSPSWL